MRIIFDAAIIGHYTGIFYGYRCGRFVSVQFIDEHQGHMAEVQEDGCVEMIELS